ncbi:MAG: biopolymer transporter ExbD [Chlamydiota bacterium]|nr:biopolymer transporter ExbD [Chlamydiota bacterium]
MQNKKRLMSDINITNLVDVTLVLLIVFILLAPMIESGIDLNLPVASDSKMDVNEQHITLSINKEGGIFWNREKIEFDELTQRIESVIKSASKPSFLIRGDEKVSYGHMIKVLDLLRGLGISQLDLATRVE